MALNSLFPRTKYAEDMSLPVSQSILTFHVIHRSFPSGAVIGIAIPLVSTYILRRPSALSLSKRILRTSSTSILVTTGLMVPAMLYRIYDGLDSGYGWKDRSWRLLHNKGQREMDDFSVPCLVAGGVLGGRAAQGAIPVWRGVIGGAGVGSVAAMVMYMAYRYGIKGGKWEETERE